MSVWEKLIIDQRKRSSLLQTNNMKKNERLMKKLGDNNNHLESGVYNNNNNNNHDNSKKCNRRISRAAKYIIQQHIERNIIRNNYQLQKEANSNVNKKNTLTDNNELENVLHRFSFGNNHTNTSSTCSLFSLYGNYNHNNNNNNTNTDPKRSSSVIMYEEDEQNIQLIQYQKEALTYNAIPGFYYSTTIIPKRYQHKYRKEYYYSSSSSTLGSEAQQPISPLDNMLWIRQQEQQHQPLGTTTSSSNNNNNNNNKRPPWYQCLYCHKIFINRYYLDLHMDSIHTNNNTVLRDDNNNRTSTKICPADDWCGTILSKQVCYDTALYLEPYYGPPSQQQQQGRRKNKNTLQQIYQKEADSISSTCTQKEMENISTTCINTINSCWMMINNNNNNNNETIDHLHDNNKNNNNNNNRDDGTFSSSSVGRMFRDSFVESFCAVQTCHGRIYRLLHHHPTLSSSSSSSSSFFYDPIIMNGYHSYYGKKHHHHHNPWKHIWDTAHISTIELGWSGIFILLFILFYYIYRMWNYDVSSSTTIATTTRTILPQIKTRKQQQQQQELQSSQVGGDVTTIKSNSRKNRRMIDHRTIPSLSQPNISDIHYYHYHDDPNQSSVSKSKKNERIITKKYD